MAANEAGPALARPPDTHAPRGGLKSALLVAAVVAPLLYVFPLFRIVPLHSPAAVTRAATSPTSEPEPGSAGVPSALPGSSDAFDPAARAAAIWKNELLPAAGHATELSALLPALRANASDAKTKFGKAVGVGAHYFFVRGSGKVVARERSVLRIAVDGAENEVIALRIGPIFGNTVRDGCGLLDVNAFPGLQEFNELSAELNTLVEKNVLPTLRDKATEGARVHFAGCAEAPDTAADAGEPALMIVPVQAEVR